MSVRENKALVVVEDDTPAAEQLPLDVDPAAPAVGKWYWVSGKTERWLGCVVHVGTNYARLKGVRKRECSTREKEVRLHGQYGGS
jgi:hypothetical protein